MISAPQRAMARRNLDRRTAPLRGEAAIAPPCGWVRAVREALGLTTRALAKRLGTSPSRVVAIEKAEVAGVTSLRTLREAAEAMNCRLVYAIVPLSSLDDVVRGQAERAADELVARLDHTMGLEAQSVVTEDLQRERKRLIDDLMAGPPRRLWDAA